MTSNHHTDEVFRPKRIVKNPIKFKIQLNEEQKEAKAKILENTLTILAGRAGSGKTLLACNIALDGLLRRHYSKIIITRPTVSKEEIGFLPGLRSKMVVCGDDHQIDLRGKADSGFRFLYAASRRIKKMTGVTLLQNHRDPIVDDLIEIYESASEKGILNTSGSSGKSRKK